MKIEEIYELPSPTQEMIDYYHKRTGDHIRKVDIYCNILADSFDGLEELRQRGKDHDKSKFGDVEYYPYIWLTDFYRNKNAGMNKELPDEVQKLTDIAIKHHYKSNRHHPEFHNDINEMSIVDLAEMVADWSSMAEEHCEESPRLWADKNIGSKWLFNENQIDIIYSFIDAIDEYFPVEDENI